MKKKTSPQMKFRKSPGETVEFLDELMKDIPGDRKKMFGYPCYFVNGNMFAGLFADDLFFRVDPEKKASVLKTNPEYREFEPLPGRIMKEYLVIPDPRNREQKKLYNIILASLEYASALPEKKKKK